MDFFAVGLIVLLILSILAMIGYILYRAVTGSLTH